jgi:hypothetical protein
MKGFEYLADLPEEEAKRQINEVKRHTETALTFVCRVCDVDQLRLLLKHGADPNLRDGHGNCPLQIAVRWNFFRGVPALLAAGAEPKTRVSHDGATLLHWYSTAPDFDRVKTLRFLITKTSLVEWIDDRKQGASDTPLETAITWCNKEGAKILLDAGARYPQAEPPFRLMPEWWKRMRVYFARFKRRARIFLGIIRFRAAPHGVYKDICALFARTLWNMRWEGYELVASSSSSQ